LNHSVKQTPAHQLILNLQVVPLPLVARHEEGPKRVFDLNYEVDATLSGMHAILFVSGESSEKFSLQLPQVKSGINSVEIKLPELESSETQVWQLKIGNNSKDFKLDVDPVRQWHLHISLHSHTDLGFTGPISEIAAIHADNTDQAMALMEDTAHWPSESQFRWTMEISWQLEQYLALRGPEAIDKLKKFLRSGQMELAAMYAGEHVDALGHEEAVRAFYLAAKYRRELKIPVDTAMLCDVPGSTEGLVQIMAKAGIKNFIIADNNFCAPVLKRTDLPRPFNWKSQSGDEITTWYTDHPFFAYIEGRNYGISESVSAARKKLPLRLLEQEKAGYAHNLLHVQYAFDNFRLEFRPALVVREWNEKWEWPKLELSTPRRFFNALRSSGAHIPTRSGDFNEWWTSTFNNYPVETSISKDLHDRIPTIETLSSLFTPWNQSADSQNEAFGKIYHNLLAWDEHSGNGQIWEAEDPEKEKQALAEGYGFIYDAQAELDIQEKRLKEKIGRSFQTAPENSFVVANSLTWERGGEVALEDWKPGESYCIQDHSGESQAHGIVANTHGDIIFRASSVPALGYRTFTVQHQKDCGCNHSPELKTLQSVVKTEDSITLTNGVLEIEVNSSTGEIERFEHLSDGKILDNFTHSDPLGQVQFWESQLADSVQMGRYIRSYYEGVPGQPVQLKLPEVCDVNVRSYTDSRGMEGIEIIYSIEGQNWLTRNLSFDARGKRLVLSYTFHHEGLFSSGLLDRLDHSSGTPSMIYIAFPFSLDSARFNYESTGMSLEAGKNQFKGSNHDFYAIHRWALLRDRDTAVAIYPASSLIADPGEPALMRFRSEYPKDTNALYFRVMPSAGWSNRSWGMGYLEQNLKLHFEIEGFMGSELASCTEQVQRYGAERATDLLASKIDTSTIGKLDCGDRQLVELLGEGLEISTIKPAESHSDDLIIRIRETMGRDTQGRLSLPGYDYQYIAECAITEEIQVWIISESDQKVKLDFQPFEIKTIRYSNHQREAGNT